MATQVYIRLATRVTNINGSRCHKHFTAQCNYAGPKCGQRMASDMYYTISKLRSSVVTLQYKSFMTSTPGPNTFPA